jgi:hypothetical protein
MTGINDAHPGIPVTSSGLFFCDAEWCADDSGLSASETGRAIINDPFFHYCR